MGRLASLQDAGCMQPGAEIMGKPKMGDGDEKMGISGGGGKFQNPTTTKNPTTSEDADHVLFLSQQAGLEHVA
eukprot:scaffold3384_cov122-Skeletonema_marinoi.AAC.5